MAAVLSPRVVGAALAAGSLLLAACARTVVVAPPAAPSVGAEETGLASWYGHPYHGRRTANGEVYDMHDMTAAHRTLPMGTRVLVTNLVNAQAVDVRVNDRGPFVDGRIVDLSYAAARVLGADQAGVVPVRLRVVGLPGPGLPDSSPPPVTGPIPPSPVPAPSLPAGTLSPLPAAEPRAPSSFTVQVAAFTARGRAEALRDALVRGGEPAAISEAQVGGDVVFRVRVGAYTDRGAARSAAERLAARGYRPMVTER